MKREADVFVGISHIVDVRKDALVSSKNVLGVLKEYDKFHGLRAEKAQLMTKFYRVLGEIASLNRKLKAALPKVTIEEEHLPAPVLEKPISVPKTGKSKLDVLEQELVAIEARLNALG